MWAKSVIQAFKAKGVVGVSGPTIIEDEWRRNRDLFKYAGIRRGYDYLFLPGQSTRPGRLSSCGANSTASNDVGQDYEGEVDYLEACNMHVLRKEALDVGGFDHNYKLTSEWCEVDLALKIKSKGRLRYSKHCLLYHRPSAAGIYRARLSTRHRFENFTYFQKKWIKPSLRRHLYWAFVWTYLRMKEWRMI